MTTNEIYEKLIARVNNTLDAPEKATPGPIGLATLVDRLDKALRANGDLPKAWYSYCPDGCGTKLTTTSEGWKVCATCDVVVAEA